MDTGIVKAETLSQTFVATGSTQTFTVPSGVTTIRIRAIGATGGRSGAASGKLGGKGALVEGDFSVTPGDAISVRPGTAGFNGSSLGGGGGGGGTFVWRTGALNSGTLLIVGGGGGGGGNTLAGRDGTATTQGGN
ncbi:MAG: hypothetical protein O2854_02090, partial [Chloroflexi bacterium]|nr:hypothetical protein [Chloroflexota bacterium]